MFKQIKEANVTIEAPVEEKISKELPVFYNPAMKLNRDLSVLLLNSVDNNSMLMCDLLAGSGVRSIRFLSELKKGKIESITINDSSADAVKLIKKNIALNKKNFKDKSAEVKIANEDASLLLLKSTGFDYIDIDPFGTPCPFLDAAIKRLARDGIIAVTATDTSSLAGTFPKVCQRRYWATPDNGHCRHEVGLRILIRKVQLVASQYEKALVPIFSYTKDHYMRVFFRCKKGKSAADEVISKHGCFNGCGPMWLGSLWDKELVSKMFEESLKLGYEFDSRFLQEIKEEAKIDVVGFHDIHELCSKLKIDSPKFDYIFDAVKKKGFPASRTHFSDYGIRSSISEKDLLVIIGNIKS